MTGVTPDSRQEPRTSSGSPTCTAGTQVLGSSAASQAHQQEAQLEAHRSRDSDQTPWYGRMSLQVSAWFTAPQCPLLNHFTVNFRLSSSNLESWKLEDRTRAEISCSLLLPVSCRVGAAALASGPRLLLTEPPAREFKLPSLLNRQILTHLQNSWHFYHDKHSSKCLSFLHKKHIA